MYGKCRTKQYNIITCIDNQVKLIQIGGKRCHDEDERTCLFNQLGSDPADIENSVGSGYLTVDQFAQLIKEAEKRNIEIIPRINMGRSARAAVVPLKQHPDPEVQKWLFDPTDDTVFYDPRFPEQDSAINPCRNESLEFFKYLVNYLELIYTHDAKVPLRNMMVGTDVSPEQVMTSKHCLDQPVNRTANPNATEEITLNKVRFVQDMHAILTKRSIQLMGPDDIFFAVYSSTGTFYPTRLYGPARFNRFVDGDVIGVHQAMDTLVRPRRPRRPRRGEDPRLRRQEEDHIDHLFQRGAMMANHDYKVETKCIKLKKEKCTSIRCKTHCFSYASFAFFSCLLQ